MPRSAIEPEATEPPPPLPLQGLPDDTAVEIHSRPARKAPIAGTAGYGTTAKYCTEIYGNDEGCLKAGRDLEVLARLGFKAGPDTLVYGLAGYANGEISATYVDFADFTNNDSASQTGGGLRVGAGVEQAYGKVFAKLEYRYTSYTKSDIGFGANVGFNRHQVLLGAGYRF